MFEDYIKFDVRYQKDAFNIISWVLKQISRGRFEIVDNICKVKILLSEEKRTVILSNTITIYEFRELKNIAFPSEPSLDFLYDKIKEFDGSLIICLKNYQEQFYKLGIEFENKYWYKFYSTMEIKDGMRKLYQVKWIDYEKQLKKESIIHDESGLCGLWAMPYNMVHKCLNEQCIKRYGDKLFVLKTVPECRYINDGKEIIGDRFEVVASYDLNFIEDIGKLIEHLIYVEESRYENIISELNARIIGLENDNTKVIDNQIYLRKVKNRYNRPGWLFMLIGIIFGIIICKFM